MRYLILSDIHGNWEALEAALQHAAGSYEAVCCLGDLVGYGADPNAVTEWVREHVQHVVRGNHDKACCGLEDPAKFNPVARQAAEWTRAHLSAENGQYLRGLRQGPLQVDEFLLVHGSLLDEDEYLVDPRDAARQFPAAGGRPVFFGHTHVQGGFLLRDLAPDSPSQQRANGAGNFVGVAPREAALFNPGSVGQPRDLCWQAAYAIYDSERRVAEFRRCSYDLDAAQRKIREAGLPSSLAERLAEGR